MVIFSELPRQDRTIFLAPIDLQKIKNHLLSSYSIAEPGRFSYYLDKDQEHFWRLISEKYPIPNNLKLSLVEKANVVWERLEKEPSPRRFIELCQAVADHICYVSYWPATERDAPNRYGGDSHSILLWEVRDAFIEHGFDSLIQSERSDLNVRMIGKLIYIGNNFGQEESEQFIANVFRSEVVDTIIVTQSQKPIKKHWYWSRLGFKIKPPFAEISVEADKK